MRTQDYLQQAVNNLRQAALARKAEVDEMQKRLADQDKFMKDQTNMLKQREAAALAAAGQTDSDQEKANRAREAQLMRVEESQINQEINYQKQQMSEQLSRKQRNIDELNQMAQSIQSNWIQL